ncbi:MAG TPA: peptidylprolyl isomerase [Thermotogota bacterium]|nr:peptidylprolyl isomerase [Thermotogota bacterium]HRW34174.1 peptidylprolyl isomerase [Thermotogota bacterium]
MRDFILKWKVVIIWAIVIIFTAGIVWWGVASYIDLGASQAQQDYTPQEYVPDRSEALAVITKDSTDLHHSYWLMSNELSQRMQEITEYYRNYGQNIDEMFQAPYLELNTAKSLIDNKIVEYYADQTKLAPTQEEIDKQVETLIAQNINTDEIKQLVVQRYGSLDNYKAYIRPYLEEQMKLDNVKAQVAQVTEEDIRAYFEVNKEELTSENNKVKVAHILVDELEQAQDILKQIQDGEITFSEAAVAYSKDTSNSANGGELDWFTKGQMVQPFEEAAFNGQIGTIVGPVETSYGYHLIEVQDRKKLETYEDFAGDEELYNQTKTQLQNEGYTEWLKTYKEENHFDYMLNDDVLNVYDKYQKLTDNYELTDNLTMQEFASWLEPFLLVEKDGEKHIDTEVDPRNIAVYVTTLENMNANFNNQMNILDNFNTVKENTPEDYISMSIEQLASVREVKDQERLGLEDEIVLIEEKMAETGKSTGTEDTQTYLENLNQELTAKKSEMNQLEDEISVLSNATRYHNLADQLAQENIQADQVNEVIKDLEEQIKANETKIVEGLNILYQYNTTSTQVINLLRKYQPENSEVALKWFQNQIDQYMMYLNDEEIFKQYRMILEPQLLQYQLGIAKIAQSEEEPIERRVSAYEILVTLMEKWGKYDEEVLYLEELKTLQPEYEDIDTIIQQVKDAAAKKAEELENLTVQSTDSSDATSTQ